MVREAEDVRVLASFIVVGVLRRLAQATCITNEPGDAKSELSTEMLTEDGQSVAGSSKNRSRRQRDKKLKSKLHQQQQFAPREAAGSHDSLADVEKLRAQVDDLGGMMKTLSGRVDELEALVHRLRRQRDSARLKVLCYKGRLDELWRTHGPFSSGEDSGSSAIEGSSSSMSEGSEDDEEEFDEEMIVVCQECYRKTPSASLWHGLCELCTAS